MDMQQGKLPLQTAALLDVAEAGRAPFYKIRMLLTQNVQQQSPTDIY